MINTSLTNYATIQNLEDAKNDLTNAYQNADAALKSDVLERRGVKANAVGVIRLKHLIEICFKELSTGR